MTESVTENVPNWMNHKYHPKSCEDLEKLYDRFAENTKAAYADDEEKLKIELEKIKVTWQIRLKKRRREFRKLSVKLRERLIRLR
jgi:hypothetical protein